MKRIAIFIGPLLFMAWTAMAADIPKSPFAMDPPPGWQVSTSGVMGSLIFFMDAPRDGFAASINVLKEKVGETTLDEYVNVSYENLQKSIPDFRLIHKEKTAINGIPFGAFEYAASQGKLDLHVYQVFAIYKSVAYLFTGASLEKCAGEYIPIIKNSLHTIRITAQAGHNHAEAPEDQ